MIVASVKRWIRGWKGDGVIGSLSFSVCPRFQLRRGRGISSLEPEMMSAHNQWGIKVAESHSTRFLLSHACHASPCLVTRAAYTFANIRGRTQWYSLLYSPIAATMKEGNRGARTCHLTNRIKIVTGFSPRSRAHVPFDSLLPRNRINIRCPFFFLWVRLVLT